jgi:hypothetical protein
VFIEENDVWNWIDHSSDELRAHLQTVSKSVPPRGKGRTNVHTERATLCNLFATIANLNLLDYPLRPEKGERPDIVLSSPSGCIGIEVTEAIPEHYARALAIKNREFPNAYIDLSMFSWGSKPKTSKMIRDIFRTQGNRLSGLGWTGDSVERQWTACILEAVKNKTLKLNEPTWRLQKHNWLSIYDNIPQAALDLHLAMELLLQGLAVIQGTVVFSNTFVESSGSLVIIQPPGFHILQIAKFDIAL